MSRSLLSPSPWRAVAPLVPLAFATPLFAQTPSVFGRPAITYCIRNTADAHIAVSGFAAVHTMNSQIAIYDGGANMSTRAIQYMDTDPSGSGFFTFFGGALGGTRIVDSKTIYDQYNSRFIVVGLQQDGPTVPSGLPGIYIAGSENDNPSLWAQPGTQPPAGSNWRKHRTPLTNWQVGGVPVTPDYNGLGIDSTRLVYSGLLADANRNILGHVYRVFQLANVYSAATPLPFTDTFLPGRTASQVPQPAHCYGGSSTLYLVGADGPGALRVTSIDAAGVRCERVVAVPTFQLPGSFGIGVPQAGTTTQLDPSDGRIQNAVVREGRLWTCHTVVRPGVGGKHVVRWYEIDLASWPANGCLAAGPTLVQSGEVDLPNNAAGNAVHTFCPSIMVDRHLDVGIVFARGAANEAPSVHVVGHIRNAAPGSITNPGQAFTGGGAINLIGNNGTARWGDYFGIALSPFDERTMYIAGTTPLSSGAPSYCNVPSGSAIWQTHVGRFKLIDNGSFTQFGVGTPGLANLIPFFVPASTSARIGSVVDLRVQNVTQLGAGAVGLWLLALGQANPPVPVFNGQVLVDPATVVSNLFVFPDNVEALLQLPIPFNSGLINTQVFMQCIELGVDPDFAFTAGLQVRVGVL